MVLKYPLDGLAEICAEWQCVIEGHLLVCNTDPSNRPGSHWIAIYVEDGRGEFFDSFGRRPNATFEPVSYTHLTLPTIYSV